MMPTLVELGIDRLPVDQRLRLAQQIIDSVIAEQNEPPLTEAEVQEIQNRVARYEVNPDSAATLEEFASAARSRFAP